MEMTKEEKKRAAQEKIERFKDQLKGIYCGPAQDFYDPMARGATPMRTVIK